MKQEDLVRLLYEEMTRKRKVNVVRKDGKSWFTNLAAGTLELLKVQPAQVFREDMVTTITHPLDATIYTPYEPGVPNDKWGLDSQEEVLAHELTHVDDARTPGALDSKEEAPKDAKEPVKESPIASLDYDTKYLLSPARRAYAETRARHADVEYMKFRFGIDANIDWLAESLKLYACSAEVPFVHASLESVFERVKRGGISNKAVIDMLEIVRREDPDKIAWDPLK